MAANSQVVFRWMPELGPRVPEGYAVMELTNLQSITVAGRVIHIGEMATPAEFTQFFQTRGSGTEVILRVS